MENSKIIDWILRNKDTFNLKVTRVTGLNHILNEYYDYVVEIKMSGRSFSGRGTDKTEDVAFLKAFSESIERYFTHKNNFLTTNGIAVHYDKDECILNAKMELIERDIFLCHFLLGGKLIKFENKQTKLFQERLWLQNINVDFYKISDDKKYKCVLVFVSNSKQSICDKIIFGVSCKNNLDSAIEQATVEALRDFININENKEGLSVEHFNCLDTWSLKDHQRIGLNSEYARKYFETRVNVLDLRVEYVQEIVLEKLESDEFPQGFPFVCLRATCRTAQDLWIGKTTIEKINKERLNQISKTLNFIKIPHFFN